MRPQAILLYTLLCGVAGCGPAGARLDDTDRGVQGDSGAGDVAADTRRRDVARSDPDGAQADADGEAEGPPDLPGNDGTGTEPAEDAPEPADVPDPPVDAPTPPDDDADLPPIVPDAPADGPGDAEPDLPDALDVPDPRDVPAVPDLPDPPDVPDLPGCVPDPACVAPWTRVCATATSFRECGEVAPSCLKLGPEQHCAAHEVCAPDGSCACADECIDEGGRRCLGPAAPRSYQECSATRAGCLFWGPPDTCGEGSSCAGDGVCLADCVPDCDLEGGLRCESASRWQACVEAAPGCLRWGQPTACGDGLTCSAGRCLAACQSDPGCSAVGVPSCFDAGSRRLCTEPEPGCLKWGLPEPCPAHQACVDDGCSCEHGCDAGHEACAPEAGPGWRETCATDAAGCRYLAFVECGASMICSGGDCIQACISDPGCSAPGTTRCDSAEAVATCAAVAGYPDCLRFDAGQPCPVHQACGGDADRCECVVEAGCPTPGVLRCTDGTHVQECRQDVAGCLYWDLPRACPGEWVCENDACGEACLSDPGCFAGAIRCDATGLEQACAEAPGHPGCLKWGAGRACPGRQECAAGSAGCACVAACGEGEARCAGRDAVQGCEGPDGDGCLFWGEALGCPDARVCVLGQCRDVRSPEVACGDVTIRYVDEGNGRVQLAWGADAWQARDMSLADGVWSVTVRVESPGAFEYKLVVDGVWVTDPLNPRTSGEGTYTNSVADVPVVATCTPEDGGRCTPLGSLETCEPRDGCLQWGAAADPCTADDRYCRDGACQPIVSPVLTISSVTFTVRDPGFPVEVTGDFTSPAWGEFVALEPADGVRTVTLQRQDWYPGLSPGLWRYKFRAPDSGLWFHDPANPDAEPDGLGGFNSLFEFTNYCGWTCDFAGRTKCYDEHRDQQCAVRPNGCLEWALVDCAPGLHCVSDDGCMQLPRVEKYATDLYRASFYYFLGEYETIQRLYVQGDMSGEWTAYDDMLCGSSDCTDTVWDIAPGRYYYLFSKWYIDDWLHFRDPNNDRVYVDGTGREYSWFDVP